MPRKLHISDKQLFTLNLFSAFVNNNYIETDRRNWYNFWKDGIDKAETIKIHHSVIAPILLMSIINVLEYDDFPHWFLSTNDKNAGWPVPWNPFNVFNSGPIIPKDGIKLKKFFNDIKLNKIEEQKFNKFIIIEEVEDTIIFLLNSELLENEGMVKCFIEMFSIISMYSKSKTFIIYFREKHHWVKSFRIYLEKMVLSKNYDYGEVIYDLLITNFGDIKVEGLLDDINDDNNLRGFFIDLNKFTLENSRIKLIVNLWNNLNEYVGGTMSKL